MRFTCYGTSHGGTSHIKANLSPSMVWFKDELGESGGYVTPRMNHPRKKRDAEAMCGVPKQMTGLIVMI